MRWMSPKHVSVPSNSEFCLISSYQVSFFLSLSLSLFKSFDFFKREKTKVFQCFWGRKLTSCMQRDMVDFMLN